MADTVNIDLDESTYTDLTTGSSQGFISVLRGSNPIEIVEAATGVTPAATISGHAIERGGPGLTYNIQAGQSIYGKSANVTSVAVVTPQ